MSRNRETSKAPMLLRWFLPEALQEAVIGDLHEELNRGTRSTSLSARAWYWRQVFGISAHFAKDTIARWRFGFASTSGAKSPSEEPSGRAGRSKAERFATVAQNVGQDLRFALRQLRKNPSFAIVAVLALALGIATNATIFSLVNAVLLRPLPYAGADRLVLFHAHILPQAPQLGVSGPELALFREQCTLFEDIAAYTWASVNLTQTGEPEELQAGIISANFFQTFGVPPLMGTAFLPDADKGEDTQVAVLSYGLWQRRFGGDPGILRKRILVDGQSRTVIGIMPATFKVLQTSATSPNDVDIWLPPATGYQRLPRLDHNLQIIAKRKAGVTVAQAQADINSASEEVKKRYFSFAKFDFGVDVVSLYGEVVKRVRPALLVLLGAVAFVLLIACVNVANLLLAKAVSREREIAIRTTLGASRSRLISQLMTESLALALCGGLVGLLLSVFGLRALIAIAPDNIPRLSEISLDGRVMLFTIVTAVVTGIAFGLVPAFQISKPGLNETMNDGNKSMTGGTRSLWLRKVLLVSEVALALISLTGAGLMIRSFLRLQQVNPGFQSSNLLTAELSTSSQKYDDSAQSAFFYQRALESIGALPGVQSAGAVSVLPLTGKDSLQVIAIDGPPGSRGMNAFQSQYRTVTSNYFSTMKIPLIAGRFFSEQDGADNQRVAIVNEDCAKRLWPGQNPLGRRINLATDVHANRPWATIVGIVGETKDAGLDTKDAFQIFMPNAQRPQRKMSIVVRTAGDPLHVASALRAAVWSLDPEQPIAAIRAMDQVLYLSVAQPRFNTILLGVFAALATLLGSIGIYGLMSYSVSQRTQEIGIRIALGAQRADVARMVVGQSLRLVLVGVAVGLLGAFGATRLMSTLLFGVTPTDAATFMVVPVLIVAVAALASYLPVRRATRVDPLVALRYE